MGGVDHLGREKCIIHVKKQKGAAASFISWMRMSKSSWSSPSRSSLLALCSPGGDAGVSPVQTSPEDARGVEGSWLSLEHHCPSPSPTYCVTPTNRWRVVTCGVGRGCCKEIQSRPPGGRGVDDWIREQVSPEEADNFKSFSSFLK